MLRNFLTAKTMIILLLSKLFFEQKTDFFDLSLINKTKNT